MAGIISNLDPAWISNVLFIVVGFFAKKALAEMKEMKRDLDSIRLLLAQQYPTKSEVFEMARMSVQNAQSEAMDKWMEKFFTRVEGELIARQVQENRQKLDRRGV